LHLIDRAKTGDRQAFAALFEQYRNLVYKTAYLMLDNTQDAEDALQEVFLQVHGSLASFDPRKGAFTTWLHRITFNFCLNHRRKRRPLSLEDVSIIPAIEFPGAQLAEQESVLLMLRALSDKQQAVIILRYYWELPYAEIAQILDIPLGTVKSRLDLALKTLRKMTGEGSDREPVSRMEVCE